MARRDTIDPGALRALCLSALGPAFILVIAPDARAGTNDALAPVQFNADFLQKSGDQAVDVAVFAKGNPVLPGDYLVDLVVNDQWLARVKVRFVAQGDSNSARPCIDRAVLAPVAFDPAALPAAARTALASGGCTDLTAIIKDASIDFDQSVLKLSISLPQAMLLHRARGYVGPQFWDRGVPSATLAYDASVFETEDAGVRTTSAYVGITAGLNLGSWHFRERSALNATNGKWHFQNIAAYVQHDLPAIKGSLTIGDTFTDGAVFDSFGFRGVSLASDDRMRPESQQGYAPIIKGIARTNARVKVTQNGSLLLETTVAPGPFVIDDLYPTGYGGDLLVTVLEADGSQESFSVTYASLAQLLRPNVWRYSLAAGDMTVGGIVSRNHFFQGVVQHGLTNLVTAYGGTALAPDYVSGLIGAALNTSVGAFAADVTVAHTRLPTLSVDDDGYSVRLSYSKIVPGLLTNITVATYRDSSSGFWSIEDAMGARVAVRNGNDVGPSSIQRQRDRLQLNLSQNLGRGLGSLFLTGSTTSYWTQGNTITQFQAGYSNVIRIADLSVNFGLTLTRQHNDSTGQTDNRAMATASFALNRHANAPRVTTNLIEDRAGGQSQTSGQLAFSGSFGADQEYQYQANANLAPHANSISVGGGYRAPFASLSATASTGTGFTQFSFGASGGVVVHPGGVTLANQLGDTIAVVEAQDAKGATVSSSAGVRIDGAGYAVLPYLMPYRMNDVRIDPQGIPDDVELTTTSQQVAPRANTVVMLKYETVSGQALLITALLPDGSPVPFGASVSDAKQAMVGLVGQFGQIYLRGAASVGNLLVKWGETSSSQCTIVYKIPDMHHNTNPIIKLNSVCGMSSGATK